MCFRRSDGKRVKDVGIIAQAGAFFMPTRSESQNYYMEELRCEPMDEFIARERKLGNSFNYTHLLIASIVRLLYLRPRLNYFISNCVLYEHKKIVICMVVKNKLSDDGEEVEMKLEFTGRENIYEVKEIVDKGIADGLKSADSVGGTNKAANFLNHLPAWVFRMVMSIVRWLDKHNMLPKALIKASPFHCSCFITNLKSIKLDNLHHHLYNFGTCSIFVAMGKEKMRPIVEANKEIKMGKVMKVGFTLDDRNADGFYYAKSVRMWRDILSNADCLKESMPEDGSKKMVIKKRKKKKLKTKKPTSKKKETAKQKKLRLKALREERELLKEKLKEEKKALREEEKQALKELRKKIKEQKNEEKEVEN